MTNPGEDPDDPVQAGEYVLGLLSPEEAEALEREARTRPGLRAEIAGWEARLAPLLAQVPPVPPPPGLWRRVEASAFGPAAPAIPRPPARGRPPGGVWGGLATWRAATAGFAVAAAVAGIALLRAPAAPVPVAALQPTSGTAPAIVAELMADGRLALRPLMPLPVAAGHDLQLWSLPDGAARPVSLGVLPRDGLVLAAGRTPQAAGRLLVSLEPAGGSPTGLPTGAVLWAGTLATPR